jgi:hypothetical protein
MNESNSSGTAAALHQGENVVVLLIASLSMGIGVVYQQADR